MSLFVHGCVTVLVFVLCECVMQDTELSLQLLTGGLKELVRMKMDLSQYVAAGDSSLLEQQLEQLHSQWEELCMKVSAQNNRPKTQEVRWCRCKSGGGVRG